MSKKRSSSEDDEIQNLQFKVILLGDGAVGKTSIATRFTEDKFNQKYKQTVGVDFFIRRITYLNYQIALQIWDIGGQSIGSKMLKNYISGAHAVLLCYDITNYESFSNLEEWNRLVYQAFEGKPLPYTALVANKFDLRHLATVRVDQHNKFSTENEMASYFISAKSGDQVKQTFWKLAVQLAGAPMPKSDMEVEHTVVPAMIINHQQHDEEVNGGKLPDMSSAPKSSCTLS